jgi:hypothetical protein
MQALCQLRIIASRCTWAGSPITREFNAGYLRVCGNEYDKAFRVTQGGKTLTFDSFECAIHAMAPQFAHREVGFWGMELRFEPRFLSSAHARVPGQRSLQGPFFKLLEQNGKAVGQLTLHRRILVPKPLQYLVATRSGRR